MTDNENTAANHRRIARNTLFLWVRQLLVMFIALYTSRVILEALGVVDFGVYNVVAGISTSMVFFSTNLAASTQRFLNYEMGRGRHERVRRVFSVSFWTYAALGGAITVIGLAIGPWLVYDVLNIPADRMTSALVVFYAMIVTMALSLLFSVYEAVLIARENMKIYAYLGLADAIIKLGIAYVVMVVPERLITYGLLMVLAMLVPKVVMVVYCRRNYAESRIERVWDPRMLKDLMGFAGWNLYDGMVYVFNTQGLNVVLNLFFGPVVNAARGVAAQVMGAVINFSCSFFTAVRPQIIKNYASGAYDEVIKLVSMSTRGTFFLIWILAVPIMLRTHYILSLWLVEIPGYTVVFIQWTIVFLLVNSLQMPLSAVAQATGDLKRYTLVGINAFFAAFPVCVVALLCGAPAWSVYPIIIVGRFLSVIIPLYTLRPYIVINPWRYAGRVLAPIAVTVGVSFALSWALDGLFGMTFGGLVLFGLVSVTVTMLSIVMLGLTSSERSAAIAKLSARFVRR